MLEKGAALEELVRGHLAQQGFFAVRSIMLRFENEDVTDIDVWGYSKPSVGASLRTVADVKDKHRPKACERILWVRGLQSVLACDRAIVATTDTSIKVLRYARRQGVQVLPKSFLQKSQGALKLDERLSMEGLLSIINANTNAKTDGDWVRQLAEAKSALVSLNAFQAFNRIMASFRFFASRLETRSRHREQVLRCVYFTAALACIALDAALEPLSFDEPQSKFGSIAGGVTYGDVNIKKTISQILEVMAERMSNGRILARQTQDAFDQVFKDVRSEVIAEFFHHDRNANLLFSVGRELDSRAHDVKLRPSEVFSTDARSVLAVFADFVNCNRIAILKTPISNLEQVEKPSKGQSDVGKPSSIHAPAAEVAAESGSLDASTNDSVEANGDALPGQPELPKIPGAGIDAAHIEVTNDSLEGISERLF